MLDFSGLTLSCLEDNARASKIDYDKESHSCPDKAFGGVLTTSHSDTEQALKESHQDKDDYNLTVM